jgi:hypothetical protein
MLSGSVALLVAAAGVGTAWLTFAAPKPSSVASGSGEIPLEVESAMAVVVDLVRAQSPVEGEFVRTTRGKALDTLEAGALNSDEPGALEDGYLVLLQGQVFTNTSARGPGNTSPTGTAVAFFVPVGGEGGISDLGVLPAYPAHVNIAYPDFQPFRYSF